MAGDETRDQAPEETGEHRLKRVRMRSWRRGTREMDLILGPFADTRLAGLEPGGLAAYERLLDENDQDLYLWVTGAVPAPPDHRQTIAAIRGFHDIR